MNYRTCPLCPDVETAWEQDDPTGSKLASHQKRQHGIEPAAREPLPQLPYVEFQAAFVQAVQALPIGWIGTTADLHALVAPPTHPNHWGLAQTHVSHMGLVRERNRVESKLETTAKSLVREWERVEPARRSA
jgi:hypothetical protein